MKTYTLIQNVFSQTLSATGSAVSEGYLQAGTVVAPVRAKGAGNRASGVVVKIVRVADHAANGQSADGLALENLCVGSLAEVSEVSR